MSRKHDVNEIELSIDDIEIYPPYVDGENVIHNGCIRIYWSSNIGFGQYDLYLNKENQLCGDSEYMDRQEDKDFIGKLLELLKDKLLIIN